LRDGDVNVRFAALHVIAQLAEKDNTQVVSAVRICLRDKNASVRYAARQALAKLGAKEGGTQATTAVDDYLVRRGGKGRGTAIDMRSDVRGCEGVGKKGKGKGAGRRSRKDWSIGRWEGWQAPP